MSDASGGDRHENKDIMEHRRRPAAPDMGKERLPKRNGLQFSFEAWVWLFKKYGPSVLGLGMAMEAHEPKKHLGRRPALLEHGGNLNNISKEAVELGRDPKGPCASWLKICAYLFPESNKGL